MPQNPSYNPINLAALLAAVRKWMNTSFAEDVDPIEHLNDALVPFGLLLNKNEEGQLRDNSYVGFISMVDASTTLAEPPAIVWVYKSPVLTVTHAISVPSATIRYCKWETRPTIAIDTRVDPSADIDQIGALTARIIRAQVQ